MYYLLQQYDFLLLFDFLKRVTNLFNHVVCTSCSLNKQLNEVYMMALRGVVSPSIFTTFCIDSIHCKNLSKFQLLKRASCLCCFCLISGKCRFKHVLRRQLMELKPIYDFWQNMFHSFHDV